MKNTESLKPNVTGVSETMLIPLYARAVESQRKNHLFVDDVAVNLVNTLDYDFSKFAKGKMSIRGVSARTVIFDREVKNFIKSHPNCTCINIGCGLDTRFHRVDNGLISWYDIDLPAVIDIRQNLLPSSNRGYTISGSILDDKWISSIKKNSDVVIILEGLLMYFDESEIKQIFSMLTKNFPNCRILAELGTNFLIKNQKKHDTVAKTNAVFKWGVNESKDVEFLCPCVKLIDEWNLTNTMKIFSPVCITVISPILRKVNNRIAMFKAI